MRHDVSLEGFAFRLRPIADGDAPLVVGLRRNPALNRYLHASSNRMEDQLDWLQRYYARKGDYYFVVERRHSGIADGVIAIYDIDPAKGSGEWGRWILKPGSLAAVESAWLIYRAAFELLGISDVYCRTVADNTKVVSFHDSCGIAARRVLPGHFELDGQIHDAIEHRIDLANWLEIKPRLSKLSELTARKIAHV